MADDMTQMHHKREKLRLKIDSKVATNQQDIWEQNWSIPQMISMLLMIEKSL
jgi:hypothetical protein